jgi:hypothetical protein
MREKKNTHNKEHTHTIYKHDQKALQKKTWQITVQYVNFYEKNVIAIWHTNNHCECLHKKIIKTFRKSLLIKKAKT